MNRIIIFTAALLMLTLPAVAAAPAPLKAYYTRLPYDDHGMTGKYADIVVELPQRGQFVFSREFGYQPRWQPTGGKARKGNS